MRDGERCTECGREWDYRGVYYWNRRRVCGSCHEQLELTLNHKLADAAARDYQRRWRIGKSWAARHCSRRLNAEEAAIVFIWIAFVAGMIATSLMA